MKKPLKNVRPAGRPQPSRKTAQPSIPNEAGTGLVEEPVTVSAPPPPPAADVLSPLVDDGGIIGHDDPATAPRPAPAASGEEAPAAATNRTAPGMKMWNGENFDDFEEQLLHADASADGADGADGSEDGATDPDAQYGGADIDDEVGAQMANGTADFLLNLLGSGADLFVTPLRGYDETQIEQELKDAQVPDPVRKKALAAIQKLNKANEAPGNRPLRRQYRAMLRGPLAKAWAASGMQEIPPTWQLMAVLVMVVILMSYDTKKAMKQRDRFQQQLLASLTTQPVAGSGPLRDGAPTAQPIR